MSEKDTGTEYDILHVFADHGVESEALTTYGDVHRIGWNVRDTNDSTPIQANVKKMPIKPSVKYDLVFLHPPCAPWAETTRISGDPDDHEDLIPLARRVGREYGDDYIIENKPQAPLVQPEDGSHVTLEARMFAIPIVYKRSFEVSFPVPKPPIPHDVENECSPYFSADRSKGWWASVKGYSSRYTKKAIARNSVPSAYVHYLMRAFLRHKNETDASVVWGHESPGRTMSAGEW